MTFILWTASSWSFWSWWYGSQIVEGTGKLKFWPKKRFVGNVFDVNWFVAVEMSTKETKGPICLEGDAIDMRVPGELRSDFDAGRLDWLRFNLSHTGTGHFMVFLVASHAYQSKAKGPVV